MPAEQEFLIENEMEIIRNVRDAELFVPDSFEVMPFGFDVTLIVGRPAAQSLVQELINPEKLMVQAVKFRKPPWTLEEALAWLQDNQKNFNSVDNLKKYAAELKTVKGVEIFSAGVWNGDEYTVEDLEIMVKAFNENSEGFRPPLKLGHSENQKLIQKDGLPAAGWVGNLYISGEKLLADFIDIPKKIFELIENKAYRKVSSEIYWNIKLGKSFYKRALSAVSLLGAENPGVTNLSDILANYNFKTYKTINDLESKIYFQGDKKMPKTEEQILLEKEVSDLKQFKADTEAKELEAKTEVEAKDAEIAELKKFKEEQDAKILEAEAKAKEAELASYVTSLKQEKLCIPSMEKYVNELMSDKKEYTIDEKAQTKQEILKEMLKLFKAAAEVNFDENSLVGNEKTDSKSKFEAEIEKYSTEHKVDYSTAYRAVLNATQVEEENEEED